MSNKTKTNLFLDITIFIAFLMMSNPALTGFAVHEWLGVSFSAALITHVLLHWDWVVSITKTFFKKLIHESRLNYAVDGLLFTAMTSAMLSGLMISENVMAAFGIQLSVSRVWYSIHSLSADLSLIMVGLHFALHWKWVVNSIQRYIISPVRGLIQRPQPSTHLAMQPVKVKVDENK
jgi:uncharacterized protein DUF4405